ncbi:MAG: anti-sigma factor [Chloroflexi bacterium]|nr:anti-sigma factor [Chloroflexota bacterium]
MARPPVDDHTEEFEELAGLAALDVLEGQELVHFEQHAARCERCSVMVRLDREALARAAPEMDPSPDFKQRLMQRAAAELSRQQPVDLNARREAHQQPPASGAASAVAVRPQPVWLRSPWASALAAVLVVALVTGGAYTYENQVVASYALTGSVSGSAVVVVRRSGAAELDMSGVQNPPPGYVYEAWVIPASGRPLPNGVTPSGDARLPLNGVSSGSTVAVTQERTLVDAPTSGPVMAATVQL